MRYLDPKNDLTFKKVFGQHPHLLKSFLNALLPLEEGREVTSLEYLPGDMVPQLPLLKYSIVDVRCIDNYGRQFIVEMQMLWTDSFKQRVLFNASKAYVRQLDKGHKYRGLQPVYALSLVNANFQPDTHIYYHHYAIIHHELTGEKMEGLELVFVELPKFKAQNLEEKKLQILWLRYLTEIEEKTDQPPEALFAVPEIREAIECLQESGFSRAELEAYDKYWDSISSEKTLIADAEIKGHKEGIEVGRAEGEQIGLEKGFQMSLQIVRLFQQGNPLSDIATKMGIEEEVIHKLLKETGLI